MLDLLVWLRFLVITPSLCEESHCVCLTAGWLTSDHVAWPPGSLNLDTDAPVSRGTIKISIALTFS